MQVLVGGALRCICIFVPFVAFQSYGYHNICIGHFPNETSPWCKARVPMLYNYIQNHYWYVIFHYLWFFTGQLLLSIFIGETWIRVYDTARYGNWTRSLTGYRDAGGLVF